MRSRYTSCLAARAISLLCGIAVVGACSAVNALAASYEPPAKPPIVDFGTKPATPWMTPLAIELIANGGFEGGAAGWTIVNQAGGSGDWFIFGGASAPLSALPVPLPPQGALQALTDQTGPGSHILYQDVVIPAASAVSLSLVLWYNNSAVGFSNPPSLDYLVTPNQQFRIDVMNPLAPVDDVGAGVLANLFLTGAASPPSLGYTVLNANLTPFSGQTIRLRFAEVDNQLFFNAGVDAVSLQAEPLVPAVSSTWGAVKDRYR